LSSVLMPSERHFHLPKNGRVCLENTGLISKCINNV
jgi:hypothetical protein